MTSNQMGPVDILQMGRGFFSSRLILTAAELQIFDKLPSTPEKLCDTYGWDIEAVIIFLDALTAMQLTEKSGKEYSIAENLKKALSRDPEHSILPMLEHFHHLWDEWSNMGTIIQNGREIDKSLSFIKSDKILHSFIGAMHTIGKDMAKSLLSEIKPVWAGKMLDIGGASGTYTIEFLNNVPELSATLFDLPDVIPMAEKRIASNNLTERVTLVPGDFYKDSLPKGHDLVWISAIIHQNSREQNRELFNKAFDALEAGGRIWIRDHIMDKTRTIPPAGAVFAVNMLLVTPGGSTYTFAEVSQDLESAGFIHAKIIHEGENMDTVVEALKPV